MVRGIAGRALRSATATLERVQRSVRPDAVFSERLVEVVQSRPGATVVLVADRGAATPVDAALARLGTRVHRVGPPVDADLHLRLAALGGVDVLVVEGADPAERAALVTELVHHVASRGVLLLRDVGAGGLAELLQLWTERGSVADPDAPRPARRGGPRRLGVVTVERFGTHAQVAVRTGSYLKLREEQTNGYLALTGPDTGRVLETREALQWTSRATVRQAGDAPRRLPSEYSAPELNLREYAHVRCYPGQVAVQGSVVLADSFRHNQRKRLGNQRLRTVVEPFAVPDQLKAPVTPLEGDYFYLDSSYRGHFGHAMTEQLSRLWAWQRAKEAYPGLKALMLEEKRTELYPFETALYAAAGVPVDDLVLVPGPVAVERLVAATPMFSQPQYAHPDLRDLWRQVSDALDARASGTDLPRRFFCSRRHGKRACHNTEEVEQLFVDHGFRVVFPEDYSLAEQARMFRGAEAVGGFAGSAMFNLLFRTDPTKVVMVASESYWALNEYMIAAVLGHDLTVAWCRSDVPRPPGSGYDPKSFHARYTFDPDREGRLVREVLEAL